jgi:hypothetical protein
MVNVQVVFLFVIFDGEFAGCSPIGKQFARFAIGVLIIRRQREVDAFFLKRFLIHWNLC